MPVLTAFTRDNRPNLHLRRRQCRLTYQISSSLVLCERALGTDVAGRQCLVLDLYEDVALLVKLERVSKAYSLERGVTARDALLRVRSARFNRMRFRASIGLEFAPPSIDAKSPSWSPIAPADIGNVAKLGMRYCCVAPSLRTLPPLQTDRRKAEEQHEAGRRLGSHREVECVAGH